MNTAQEENQLVSALAGYSLDHILDGLSLPGGSNLSNQLGISGIPSLDSKQIYSEEWNDDDAVGPDEGEDWEDQIDRELEAEDGMNGTSARADPGPTRKVRQPKEKRIKLTRRVVERPKSVYERFPAFEKNNTLDFSELFKGYTVKKSRLAKRPFHG